MTPADEKLLKACLATAILLFALAVGLELIGKVPSVDRYLFKVHLPYWLAYVGLGLIVVCLAARRSK